METFKKIYQKLSFKIARIYLFFLHIFWSKKWEETKQQGERKLLIDQLQRTIETGKVYQKYLGRSGHAFEKYQARLSLQQQFLDAILHCNISDFEDITTKWMSKMGAMRDGN